MAVHVNLNLPLPSGERVSKTGLRPCPFCGSVQLSSVTVNNPPEFLLIQYGAPGFFAPERRET